MVGIRACKVMGEVRFAGSLLHDNQYHNTIAADNQIGLRIAHLLVCCLFSRPQRAACEHS